MKRKIFQQLLMAFVFLCLVSIPAFAVTEEECNLLLESCENYGQQQYDACLDNCSYQYWACIFGTGDYNYCGYHFGYLCPSTCENNYNFYLAHCEENYDECMEGI